MLPVGEVLPGVVVVTLRTVQRALTVCCIAASVTACEAERAPAGITCDKLRALRIGMSIDEVRALLGPPYNEIRQTGNVVFGGPEGTDMSWNWMEYSNGVRLYVSFGNGRLLGVDSWIRTMWRDFFDNESRPVLFRLNPDTRREGTDFEHIYCP